jgi:integrase/recombinase XerD
MTDRTMLGPWIRRFLLEHLVADRNLARNTHASYRDTLILLLPFLSAATTTSIDRLAIEDLSPSRLRHFLEHLETERGCRVGTRNQRLGAIHSLAKFIGLHSPEHLAWCAAIRAIPFKKTATPVMAYLDKPEMDALLTVHSGRTAQGARNHALLLFLYNTGARVDEAVHVTVADLTLGASPSVRLLGKGRKARSCPLWPVTAETLSRLVRGHAPQDAVFQNRQGRPLTRFGIYRLVRHTVTQARTSTPSLATKRVSPHTLRHTCAVHLLRAGVDINTIRAWLGHVSLDTTHVYAEVDLDLKAKALARCDLPEADTVKRWRTDPNLMCFLKAL